MADKKKVTVTTETKKPTGLVITRNQEDFSISWKIGDKNYADGQQIYWRTNQTKKGHWNKLACGITTTAKTVTLNFNNYIPHTKKLLSKIRFKIRGNRETYKTETSKKETTHKCTWSDYAEKEFDIYKPKRPKVSATLSEEYANRCSFHWTAANPSKDHRPFERVQWQSKLLKDSKVTKGKEAFKKSTKGVSGEYKSGTGGASGTEVIIEDSSRVNGATPYTRWFRARSRGPGGSSKWVYAKHVYAKSNPASNVEVSTWEKNNGYLVSVKWTTSRNAAKPINSIIVQYGIGTPGAGMTTPAGLSWNDVLTLKPKDGTDKAVFTVDEFLENDQVLFVRINTQHDGVTTPGNAVIARVGALSTPTLTNVVPVEQTHRATITATNESEVPGSFLAVTYKTAAEPDAIFIGIIEPGETQTVVQAPDWGTGEKSFGVRAFVGQYTAQTRSDGVTIYTITAYDGKKRMSSGEVWDNGAVPPAPTGVAAVPTETPGTVRVSWNNPWTAADGVELSWADHADAWESTEPPESYTVSSAYAAAWNIVGLEVGKTWFIRVRLLAGDASDPTPGPWSEIISQNLASAPNIPVLTLSEAIIAADGTVTASWGFASSDGTAQAYAEICEATINETTGVITYGDPKWTTLTAQHIDINAAEAEWTTGETYNLCVRVQSASGEFSDGWSAPVPITIAEPISAEITQTSLVSETIEENPREFAGEVVTFENTSEAGVATSLIANIDAEQDLNGYESPWIHDDNENTPYLLRSSDTVAEVGNSIFDTLVGGTLAVNQLVQNGNFADGTNNWSIAGGTMSASAGTCEITATGASTQFYQNISAKVQGHKIFYTVDVLVSANMNFAISWGDTIRGNTAVGSTKQTIAGIGIVGGGNKNFNLIATSMTAGDTIKYSNINSIDLTQFFCGSTIADYVYNLEQATAGSGVAWLKQYYPSIFNSYQPYNAGELMSVEASAHVMTGKNSLDYTAMGQGYISGTDGSVVAWSSTLQERVSDYIQIQGGNDYIFSATVNNSSEKWVGIGIYDADKNFIMRVGTTKGTGANFTQEISATNTANAKYVRVSFRTYGIAEKAQLEKGTIATDYEAYTQTSYPLDSTLTLRGIPKLNNGVPYYDGDTYKSDGSVNRRYGIVDMGSLNYVVSSSDTFYTIITDKNNGFGNIESSKYPTAVSAGIGNLGDKQVVGENGGKAVYVKDSAFSGYTAAQVKSAMSGVYLIYELATPTTETAEPFTNPQVVYADGTEEYVTNNVVPVGHVTDHANICPITGHDTVNVIVSPTTTGGTTYSMALGSTVYGGTLDIVSGVLTLTGGYLKLNTSAIGGTENWPSWINCGVRAMAGGGLNQAVAGALSSISNRIYANTTGANDILFFSAAELGKTKSELIAMAMDVEFFIPLATPTTTTLTAQQVELLLGTNNIWADTGDVSARVVDSARTATSLKDMPLTITVTGAGETGETTVAIERAESYYLDRPDERDFTGHENETIALFSQTGEAQITIDNGDLIGTLDDGAQYRIVADVSDGIGQTAREELEFEVHWSHQAVEPTATVEIDNENLIAKITPIAPAEAEPGDTCDIYRLSVDRPELIFEGAEFGTMYVDPYPALGEMGGHRIVFRTSNGDYITEDNTIAWADYTQEETGGVETMFNIIDFDGNQVRLMYDITIDAGWEKDFQQTKYLGGHIQGDWNAAVSRTGSVGGSLIVTQDQETIQNLRRLADYPGICHVRTRDGSSYAADVQVSEARDMGRDVIRSEFTLSITRVDPEGFDGLTYADWLAGTPNE